MKKDMIFFSIHQEELNYTRFFFFLQLHVNHRPSNTTYICPTAGTQKQMYRYICTDRTVEGREE